MTKKLPTLMGKLYLFFNQSQILWDTNDLKHNYYGAKH